MFSNVYSEQYAIHAIFLKLFFYIFFTAKADHDADADFEELMNFRRQKFNRYGGGGGPQRLSCVDENKEGISESLASLIADGFELG